MSDMNKIRPSDYAETAAAVASWEGEGGAPIHRWEALQVRQRLDWIKEVHSRMLGRGCAQGKERIARGSSVHALFEMAQNG
ncbi:hypothetical protein [Xanthobacter sp.]|uniref:hypothetical protein n=1 Tax=Xanthobacter sp. TaxID=35809 RepID=UPI0025FA48E2|nr:hypothetical protein [Xanthobacter sp.]